MQNTKALSCPISGIKINEKVARTIALLTLILVAIAIYFNYYFITFFLIFDFAFRSFLKGNFSFLKLISIQINKVLKIKPILVDEAPKKFAAIIGFVFVNIIFLLQYFNFTNTALIFGVLLLVCAALEGFFGFCVGCIMYQLIKKL